MGEAREPGRAPDGDEHDEGGGGQTPSGDVVDWYHRGLALLERGDAAAAAQVLGHAHAHEPQAASVQEALARALFDARRYDEAAQAFRELAAGNPDDDYARFGLGLALWRLGMLELAAEQLSLAVAMRPDRAAAVNARGQVQATLRARRAASEGTG
jgi:tetratricopeptide (TPR) repeat protein